MPSPPRGVRDIYEAGFSGYLLNRRLNSDGNPHKTKLGALLALKGQRHDAPIASTLIVPGCDYVLGDRGYDSDAIRRDIREKGAEPVIPAKANRVTPEEHDAVLYKERNAVERFFAKIKQFRRVATRYEKLARNYLAMVTIEAAIVWLKV